MKKQNEWGLIGLGVMGTALARNLARNGISLSLYNRYLQGQEEQVAAEACRKYPELNDCNPFEDLQEFIQSLQTVRKIIVMVPAGAAIDAILGELSGLLQPGDIIIDGGNSHFEKTQNRYQSLKKQGISYLGIGVSGGEKGALKGPAMMVGGRQADYETIRPVLEKIVARNKNNVPCLGYFGTGGAGHFIKTLHNGVEYGEMQLLAEVYEWMRHQENPPWQLFSQWQQTDSQSYLLGVSADLVTYKHKKELLIDHIEDITQHKGTGVWSTMIAAALGAPSSVMTAALQARFIAAQKKTREATAPQLALSAKGVASLDANTLKKAYDLARWINHHQGFSVLKQAKNQYQWHFSLATAATTWTAGCIIQSELMYQCATLLENHIDLMASSDFRNLYHKNIEALSQTIQWGVSAQLPLPAFTAAWQYIMAIKQVRSTGNFIQAQRDYFGAHGLTWISESDQTGAHGPWNNLSSL